jgi:hypothetical protein
MSKQGPSPHDEFLQWIGICIISWAWIEECLFEICAWSLGTSKDRAAIVYYRTPNLDARLSLTDELVRAALPQPNSSGHDHPDVKQWDTLHKQVSKLLPTRNRIAHHPVAARSTQTGLGLLSTTTWLEIYISDNERFRGKSKNLPPLRLDDLTDHHGKVQEILGRLLRFTSTVLPKHTRGYIRHGTKNQISHPARR